MEGLIFIGWEGPCNCFKYGGFGRYAVNVLPWLRKAFPRVIDVCLCPRECGVSFSEYYGVEVIEVGMDKLTCGADVGRAVGRAVRALINHAGRDFSDWVVMTNDFHLCPLGVLLAGWGARPYIHFMHTVSWAPCEYWCAESADTLVVASELMAGAVEEWWGVAYSMVEPPLHHAPIRVVRIPTPQLPEPSDDPEVVRGKLLRELGVDYLLLYVGRDDPYKNLRGAYVVLARLRSEGIKAGLLIITPDPVESPTSYVAVWNAVPDDVLVTAYRAADLLIHPATFEPYGLVILEAISQGLLPITTYKVGAAEWVPVPKGCDMGELASLVRRYLLNPDAKEEVLRKARAVVENYTWEDHVGELFSSVL